MTHRDPDLRHPQRYTRAQVLQFISYHVNNGLPAPKDIGFRAGSLSVYLDSVADRIAWQTPFEMTDREPSEQPHDINDPPEQWAEWITHVWASWHGWHLTLHGDDPITDEQRAQWPASDRGKRYAARLAAEAAAKGGEQS